MRFLRNRAESSGIDGIAGIPPKIRHTCDFRGIARNRAESRNRDGMYHFELCHRRGVPARPGPASRCSSLTCNRVGTYQRDLHPRRNVPARPAPASPCTSATCTRVAMYQRDLHPRRDVPPGTPDHADRKLDRFFPPKSFWKTFSTKFFRFVLWMRVLHEKVREPQK